VENFILGNLNLIYLDREIRFYLFDNIVKLSNSLILKKSPRNLVNDSSAAVSRLDRSEGKFLA